MSDVEQRESGGSVVPARCGLAWLIEPPALRSADAAGWAVCCLGLLAFVLFQAAWPAGGPQGYRPGATPGTWGVTGYAWRTVVALAVFLAPLGWLAPWWLRRIAVALLVLLALWHFGVVLSGSAPLAQGNDRAEALNIALEFAFDGRFPYDQTPRVAPVTPLTTNFLIALPAWASSGRSELASLAVIPLGFLALAWYAGRRRRGWPPEFLALAVFLNPVTLWELAWASDVMWGGVVLTLSLILWSERRLRAAAIVFGFALCTRSSFFLLVPLWGAYALREVGWRRALTLAAWAGGVALVLELPFVAWGGRRFFEYAPLGMSRWLLSHASPVGESLLSDLLGRAFPLTPWRPVVVSGLVGLASLLLGLRVRSVAELALASAALFGLMLMFLGRFFLVDYLSWMLFPLLFASLSDWGVEPNAEGI